MLSSNSLLRAIQIMGSRKEIIRLLGISAQRFDSWLNNGIGMSYEYALALEHLTFGQVTANELAPKKSQVLKNLKIEISQHIPWLSRHYTSIKDIKTLEKFCVTKSNLNYFKILLSSIKKQELLRPILVSTTGELINGKYRLKAYELLGHTHISTLVISLHELTKAKDAATQLIKNFTISERISIGIACARLLGHRQGQRNDLLRRNSDEVKVQKITRTIIAEHIGFHNGETYRQAKKVVQNGICALISAMDEEKISISAAGQIAKNPPDIQENLLIVSIKNQSKNNKELL